MTSLTSPIDDFGNKEGIVLDSFRIHKAENQFARISRLRYRKHKNS